MAETRDIVVTSSCNDLSQTVDPILEYRDMGLALAKMTLSSVYIAELLKIDDIALLAEAKIRLTIDCDGIGEVTAAKFID